MNFFKFAVITICSIIFSLCYIQMIPAKELTKGQQIVKTAEQYIGNPYVYGGSSLTQGCDCSHFVWLILKEAIQYDGEYVTSWGFETIGQQVPSLDDALAGDIICYGSHVAIYDGKDMILQAKGSQYGITHNSKAQFMPIVTIRRIN